MKGILFYTEIKIVLTYWYTILDTVPYGRYKEAKLTVELVLVILELFFQYYILLILRCIKSTIPSKDLKQI